MGSTISGVMGYEGATQAASTTAQATEYATNTQYQMYQEALGLQLPQLAQGYSALGMQDYMLGIGGSNEVSELNTLIDSSNMSASQKADLDKEVKKMYTGAANSLANTGYSYGSLLKPFTQEQMYQDPGYQNRLNASLASTQAASAATGTYGSGAMATSLQNTAGNMASQEYANAYARYLEPYTLLSGLSNTGTAAASTASNLASSTGTGIASTTTSGASQQSLYESMALKSLGSGLSGGANTLGTGIGNLYSSNLWSSLFGSSGSSGSEWGF